MFQTDTKKSGKINAMTKRVSFSTVSIRNYDITVGDSPSVSSGIPLTLDWLFVEEAAMSLNEYESNRRCRFTFLLSAEQRQQKLTECFGIDIKHVSRSSRRRRAIRRSNEIGSKVIFLPAIKKHRRSIAPVAPCVWDDDISTLSTNE
jgi:hypothetical protein